MATELYPFYCEPVYRDYIWGGDRIVRRFDRAVPPGVYAESWEVSDRPEGQSVVANGPLHGRTLGELVRDFGAALVGSAGSGSPFPLLIKLIDAHERLSVQVHPDDEAARRTGVEAKTEMWYVLDAEPDACVYAGWKPGTDAAACREGLRTERLEAMLNRVPVTAGDAVFMPGGRVHAIGAGCLLLEVQQNSNTTYRLYDWGRRAADGRARPLHVEAALQVMHWRDDAPVKLMARPFDQPDTNAARELWTCPCFRVDQLRLCSPWTIQHDGQSFHALFSAEAALTVQSEGGTLELPRGTVGLVPAAVQTYQLSSAQAGVAVLRMTLPDAGTSKEAV
jgi:mannose-6-phosphate isomerase